MVMASVQRANAGQESRRGCLALTGNVGRVGCDGCTADVTTVVTAWGRRDLEGSGLGRLDGSSLSRARRTSLSWLNNGNHLGVEIRCSGGGSSLNQSVRRVVKTC
jgi:hypothetical protein